MSKRIRGSFSVTLIGVVLQGCSQSPLVAQSVPAAPTTAASNAASGDLQNRVQALVQRVKKELVFLPGGTFEMGDWGNADGLPYDGFSEGNSQPLHEVTLDGFSMMAYKVTYEDFDLFTDAVHESRIDQDPRDAKHRRPRKPAGVNWYGAKAYCEWIGKLSGLPFDLPTEAQWEYAARSGGKRVLFATNNGAIDKDKNYPWHSIDRATPDVGSFPPNPIGIYGMADYAASEWVNDWYDPDYYKRSSKINPEGPGIGKPSQSSHPEFGPAKVLRGNASPGSNPAFGGFVFSRGAKQPRENRPEFMDEFPGYSGSRSMQFRCVKNLQK